MKKIVLFSIIIILSSAIYSSDNNDQKLFFGVGICQQFPFQYDYMIDIEGPFISINTEKDIKFYDKITSFSQTNIIFPKVETYNMDDFYNIEYEIYPYFENPFFVESLVGFRITNRIFDESRMFYNLGISLGYNQVKMYDIEFNNLNIGTFLGFGFDFLLYDDLFFSFEINHLKYRGNLCFHNQSSNNIQLPKKDHEGDAFYANLVMTHSY